MARIITKELALKIVDKLQATKISSKSSAHDEYGVVHNGQFVAFISIRRGSSKDQGHDYIPGDIHVSTSQAKRLGQCPLKRTDYLAILRERGLIADEEGQEANQA